VPEYLSPEWFVAADEAVRADASLAEASRGAHLVLEQTVDPAPGDEAATVVWTVRFADGLVSVSEGGAHDADVTFHLDRATAEAVQQGATSAQAAFMAGQLRVGGDIGALLAHQELMVGLTDVLGPLRERGRGA